METELPTTKITLDSYKELIRLKAITVSDKRFKELTGNTPPETLDETTAKGVIAHLRALEAYHALYYNIVIDQLEKNQIKPYIDPPQVAADIAPALIDIRSRESWGK